MAETDIIADKSYDEKLLREKNQYIQTQINAPGRIYSKSSGKNIDRYVYEMRPLVDNIFASLKQLRDMATRYDLLKRNY
nr:MULTISPECIES: transposase [unclassified Acinetobacter]